jgi:hypothetical protein
VRNVFCVLNGREKASDALAGLLAEIGQQIVFHDGLRALKIDVLQFLSRDQIMQVFSENTAAWRVNNYVN